VSITDVNITELQIAPFFNMYFVINKSVTVLIT